MRTNSGFTRIDLLAVVATVSLLALTLAADTRSNAEASVCLNNMRQLSRAQFLYAADHGYFPPNVGGGDSNSSQTWVLGYISEFGTETTNINPITSSLLYPYVDRNFRVFKCPAEQSVSVRTYPATRVRTVSMNHAVGTDPQDVDGPCKRPVPGSFLSGGGHTANQVFRCFARPSDIVNPTPANLFIFLDEHPDSINDSMFANNGPGPAANMQWVDIPAAYHDGAGSFGMADGHAELHQWNRPFGRVSFFPQPSNPATRLDLQWLASKTTAPRAQQP